MLRLSADGYGMVLGFEISGMAGMIAVALPIVALGIVIARSLRRTRRRAHIADPRVQTGRYGVPVPGSGPASKTTPASGNAPFSSLPAAPPAPATADDVVRAISRAEAAGLQAELAALYLALARDRIASGRGPEAISLLTKSLRLSAILGQKETQACARIELGDLARAGGDLTTACEHWQLARGLFYDLKKAGDLASAEKRMRQNGCPTDWVLNDF